MMQNKFLAFFFWLLIPLLIGGLSGFATASSINDWFRALVKPSFNPPNWIFGPVWTTLYILMGISAFVIWNTPATKIRSQALTLFWVQLILNFCWSFLFFYFKQIGFALVEIGLMWVSILSMILAFRQVSPIAAWMNLPYLAWVSFASVLNFALWKLN